MVSPMFTVMANEFYRMENKMTFGLIRHSEVILGDDAEIDYVFLSGEEADYSGMAAAVQERFLAQADRLEEQTDIPLYLETYGSINKVERFFGFPVNVKKTLTTFEQAQEMLEEFRAGGVENLNLLYQGWFNGGMRYSTPTSISVQSELGGKNGYQELVDYTRANEIGFYPAVDFQYVQAERWLDHFQVSSDTARTLGGQSAKRFSYEIETLSTDRDSGKFIVRPVRLAGVAERFLQQNEQFGLKNLYVPALGSDLNSDFTDGQECILSEAQRYSEALLQSLGDSGYELMVDTGNLYAIPYVDHVVNLPSSSSRYLIEMEEIPFVQMIYHGYVSYAGEAINQGQNDEEAFLKAVENGGGLHYALFAADPSVVKETDYADMFSAYYPMWKDKALEQYSRANAALADLSGIRIIHHDILENGLRVVTYENGTRIVVNYSDEAVAYETIQVQPKDFCRITNGEAQ